SAFTVARSVARLTLTSFTPATAFKALSTRPTQEAQVMPSMGNWCSMSDAVAVFMTYLQGVRGWRCGCLALTRCQAQAFTPVDLAPVAMPRVRSPSTFTESSMHEFHLPDMTCRHCASKVSVTLKRVDPLCEIEVDVAQNRVGVKSTEDRETLTE